MNKHCYLLLFSFFLLSGNPQSFAAGKDDLQTPLLQADSSRASYSSTIPGASIQEGASEEGRGAGARPVHSMTGTSRAVPSSVTPSPRDLLAGIDTTPAETGLNHLIHYLYFVKGKKLEEAGRGGRKLEKEDRGAIRAKGAIITQYRSVYASDDQLEGHLFAQALAAVQREAALSSLLNQSANKIKALQEVVRQLTGENQDIGRLTEEVSRLTTENQGLARLIEAQRSSQASASTAIQIVTPSAQTADLPDQQERIESLVRSNRCRCCAIGGLSTALGFSFIYATWSLIHIFH